jgi:hypothetical protein
MQPWRFITQLDAAGGICARLVSPNFVWAFGDDLTPANYDEQAVRSL